MKPEPNKCLNCGKEVSTRAKYCSDKCTKAHKRNSDKLGQKESLNSDISAHNSDKSELGQPNSDTLSAELKELRDSLTKTDKTFFDRAIRDFKNPYYNYSSPLKEDTCGLCGKDFKTNLSLNRYCSYAHYSESHKALTR
jgi:hypothetical protein